MSQIASQSAFRVAFVLSIAPMTLHDLIKSLAFEGVALDQRPALLQQSVDELSRLKLIKWRYEPDYGNSPSIDPGAYDAETLGEYWRQYLTNAFFVEVPDREHPTLFLEATEDLNVEIQKRQYEPWRIALGW